MKKVIGNPNFLRGIFSILLVILFIATFELVFYYVIVVPKVNAQLEKLSNSVKLSIPDILKKSISGIVKGIAVTDQERADYTNSLKAGIMGIIIGIVLLLLIWVYRSLRRRTAGIKHGTDLPPVFLSSIIIILIILGFQVFMYIFGNKYNYALQDELEIRFVNALLEDQNRTSEIINIPSGTSFTKQ
jgi:hypothetical protein